MRLTFIELLLFWCICCSISVYCTYRIQSIATISEMSSGGKPTEVRTITMVTRPAWGIPAAPILAAVAVILRIDGQSQVTCSFHWYMQFCHCTLVVKVTRFKYHFMFSLLYIVKCNLFLWWQRWIFSSHYSSLKCHMILQKSFRYADLVLNYYNAAYQYLLIFICVQMMNEGLTDLERQENEKYIFGWTTQWWTKYTDQVLE